MRNIGDIAIRYGQQVEGLLERLGARGPAKGAGDLLDQVKELIDPEGLRKVRWFLKLRNKVIHNRPLEMPMPSPQEVERAGRAAVEALERVLAARNATSNAVYRIRERDGAYEFWVGPGGVWTVAKEQKTLKWARGEAKARLGMRFPRLAVRGARHSRGLEARLRWGRKQLSPEEVQEAVGLLTGPPPAPSRQTDSVRPSPKERVHRVKPDGVLATFYVGPAGVLVVAEFVSIAEMEARQIWEDSGKTIAAVPAVLDPKLKEAQGHTEDGVLALRDEEAIRDYLQSGHGLDEDEVDRVAGWLRNRLRPAPILRDKKGRYRLRGKEVTEGRTKVPPTFVVELVPPSKQPPKAVYPKRYPKRNRPPLGLPAVHPVVAIARRLPWRVVFLPELVGVGAIAVSDMFARVVFVVLLLRFWASFKNDVLCGGLLFLVGYLELAICWIAWVFQRDTSWHFTRTEVLLMWILLLIPGLFSFFRGAWILELDKEVLNSLNSLFPFVFRRRVR